MSWGIVLPMDVIKSKIITDSLTEPQYKGTWDCVKKTYMEGGVVRFYQGFGILVLQAFLVNGIMFLVYERILSVCNRDETLDELSVNSKWL